jgi:hypothetical protein
MLYLNCYTETFCGRPLDAASACAASRQGLYFDHLAVVLGITLVPVLELHRHPDNEFDEHNAHIVVATLNLVVRR